MDKKNVTTNPNPATKATNNALTGKENVMENLTLEQILGHAGHPTNPLDVRAITDFGNFQREEADVAVDQLISEFQDWDDNDLPF